MPRIFLRDISLHRIIFEATVNEIRRLRKVVRNAPKTVCLEYSVEDEDRYQINVSFYHDCDRPFHPSRPVTVRISPIGSCIYNKEDSKKGNLDTVLRESFDSFTMQDGRITFDFDREEQGEYPGVGVRDD